MEWTHLSKLFRRVPATSAPSAPPQPSADGPSSTTVESARHRRRLPGRGSQSSIKPFLRPLARPKTVAENNFTLSPDLGMTDAAQSLLMHDTLGTYGTSLPLSQHSDQSFELFNFSLPSDPSTREGGEATFVVNECLEDVGVTLTGGEGQPTPHSSAGVVGSASVAGRFSSNPSDQTALLAFDSLFAKCDHIGRWCDQQWGTGEGRCEDLYRFVAPGITKRLTRLYWIYRLWKLSSNSSSMTPTIDKLIRVWANDFDVPRRWARYDNFHSSLASWQSLPSSYHYA